MQSFGGSKQTNSLVSAILKIEILIPKRMAFESNGGIELFNGR